MMQVGVCTSSWSATLTSNELGIGLTFSHLWWCKIWRPAIWFWRRIVRRHWSEWDGKPLASSGCGHEGYKFAANSIELDSRSAAFSKQHSSNPKLSEIPLTNSLVISLILVQYSSKISLQKNKRKTQNDFDFGFTRPGKTTFPPPCQCIETV